MFFKSKKELNYDRFVDLNILCAASLVHSDLRIYQISLFLLDLAPAWLEQNLKMKVSATDCALQNRQTFIWTVISKIWLRIIRWEYRFIRISNISVTRSHAQLIFRTVINKLWAFIGPWGGGGGRDRSQLPPC